MTLQDPISIYEITILKPIEIYKFPRVSMGFTLMSWRSAEALAEATSAENATALLRRIQAAQVAIFPSKVDLTTDTQQSKLIPN